MKVFDTEKLNIGRDKRREIVLEINEFILANNLSVVEQRCLESIRSSIQDGTDRFVQSFKTEEEANKFSEVGLKRKIIIDELNSLNVNVEFGVRPNKENPTGCFELWVKVEII